MKTDLHLSFNGNCREAFEYYASQLGGTPDFMPYDAEKMGGDLPPGVDGKIMHAALEVGGVTLMGADAMGDGTMFPYRQPQGFDVVLSFDDMDEAHRAYDALAEGGKARMPLEKTFFARAFGALTDRFGIHWNIHVPAEGDA